MNPVRDFGQTATSLARNPLGIIALFIVLVYAFAALLVGASAQLDGTDRHSIVLFLVWFPPVVLAVFAWLVSRHHEKLYAPRDFNSDDAFLSARMLNRPQLAELDKQIEEKITSTLTAEDLIGRLGNHENAEAQLRAAASKITREIRETSFLTIDAARFMGSSENVFEYPASAFSTFSELLNQIYNEISSKVGPYEYGTAWVLRNRETGEILKNRRMLRGISPGRPYQDRRSLAEVGITPGSQLEVCDPILL